MNVDGEAMLPDDANGDVLRRLLRDGDELSIPRDIDFSVVFPDEKSAEGFVAHFRALRYEASFKRSEVRPERPWDVTVVKHMLPTHAGIAQFELELEKIASPLGGENDGWGCFAQNGLQPDQ